MPQHYTKAFVDGFYSNKRQYVLCYWIAIQLLPKECSWDDGAFVVAFQRSSGYWHAKKFLPTQVRLTDEILRIAKGVQGIPRL